MKLRGHKIDFLKQREEKPKSKENKYTERSPEMGELGVQSSVINSMNEIKPVVPAPVIERKVSKSIEKIECNFCKRKYSNTYNLRKHILSAHDKMID